jgi:hypothetical protein
VISACAAVSVAVARAVRQLTFGGQQFLVLQNYLLSTHPPLRRGAWWRPVARVLGCSGARVVSWLDPQDFAPASPRPPSFPQVLPTDHLRSQILVFFFLQAHSAMFGRMEYARIRVWDGVIVSCSDDGLWRSVFFLSLALRTKTVISVRFVGHSSFEYYVVSSQSLLPCEHAAMLWRPMEGHGTLRLKFTRIESPAVPPPSSRIWTALWSHSAYMLQGNAPRG